MPKGAEGADFRLSVRQRLGDREGHLEPCHGLAQALDALFQSPGPDQCLNRTRAVGGGVVQRVEIGAVQSLYVRA